MRYIYLKYALSVATAVAALCSCSEVTDEPFGGMTAEPENGEVVIAVSELSEPRVATRVMIDTNATPETGGNLSAEWSEGDSFSLWAVDSDVAKNRRFDYYKPLESYPLPGNEAQPLFICSDFPKMTDGSYTYRAYHPYTDEVDTAANTITYTIPAVQTGRYESSLDIMHAEADRKDRLYLNTYNTDMGLVFKHDTHMLRIVLRENPFAEKGVTVGKIRIVFPEDVAGTLTFDAVAGGKPLFDGTSNDIVVDFGAEGLQFGADGKSEPFWVFTAQVNLSSQVVQFVAVDNNGEEVTYFSSTIDFADCAAGTITPVDLRMVLHPSVPYTVTVTDHTKLGEAITAITEMTLPEGVKVADLYQTNVARNVVSRDDSETFTVRIFEDGLQYLNGGNIDFVLESKHAEKLIPDTKDVKSTGSTLTAPYLFFEDFSGVGTVSSYDEYGRGTSSWPENYDAQTLLSSGWTAGRVGAQAGTSIRIACRRETSARYYARVDSAPIANIKDGTSVKVSIKFDYDADRWGGGLLGNSHTGGATIGQTVYLGYVTESTGYKSGDNTINEVDKFSIASSVLDGSYTNIRYNYTYEIEDCQNFYRMTWRTYPDYNASVNNNTCWLYLDNIRVSIAE